MPKVDTIHVVSFHSQHPYHRTIYDELGTRIIERARANATATNATRYRPWDVFHLHWPEWPADALGPTVNTHREFIDLLVSNSSRILWTQHNLTPHSKDPRYDAIYALWAAAADGVIHHSQWGMEKTFKRYNFRSDAVHRIIPHPHFGPPDTPSRLSARRRDIATTQPIRIGIIGAPRKEKNIRLAIQAVLASNREDLELRIFSCDPDDSMTGDRRIVFHTQRWMPRADFERALAGLDVLLMPFDSEGMLGTGTIADAIGFGIPVIISDWPYLIEVFGDSAIRYGSSCRDLTKVFCALDRVTIDSKAAAIARLRATHEPKRIARLTLDVLEAIAK